MNQEDIFQSIIVPALKRAESEIVHFQSSSFSLKAPLFVVPESMLDSLNLINFVFIIEEEFLRVTGKPLKILTQDILNPRHPPFANLESLAEFLKGKI